jgi:lysophospholipid acyltransferase (LPLAT)-like uncharacterized protein
MNPIPPRRSGTVIPHQPTPVQRTIARLITTSLRLCAATRSFQLQDPYHALVVIRRSPVIFAIWHNRLAFAGLLHRRFLPALTHGPRQLAALVSASRDGALLSAVLERFDIQPVRGSSSRRGPQSLRELTTWGRQGYDIAITPDGPRGPRYQVQSGIIALARLTGLPIIPVAGNTRWKLSLPSWDRFQIPLPFSPYHIWLGHPLFCDRDDPLPVEERALELQQRLLEFTQD